MDDLVTWLRAQLDEDERVAQAAHQPNWSWYTEDKGVVTKVDDAGEYEQWRPTGTRSDAEHIALHDPARVLAEVDAKRRILDLHSPYLLKAQSFRPAMLQCDHCADLCHSRSGLACDEPIDAPWPCPTVRLVALPYADRPGYRDEWKP